jgi:AraC-like DNA-binding protein
MDTIRIGAWSMLLLVLASQTLLLAALLAAAPGRPRGTRWLAVALVVIAGMLAPYILGYAGAYDAWPWLSFAPFAVPLALGPCLASYGARLTGRPALGWAHWLAPGLQFGFQAALFPFPVATKTRLDGLVVEPFLGPVFAAAVLVSMLGYGALTLRMLRDYGGWLRARRRSVAPTRRLMVPVAALSLLVAVRAGYDLFALLVRETDYFDRFAFYVLLGVIGVWLGADALRSLDQPAPEMAEDECERRAAQGGEWIATVAAREWWREPELTADLLARRLGTNRAYLSRAFNAAEGPVPAVLNRLRAEAVAAELERSDADLLAIAFACGFNSKPTFNRAFAARFDCTPSEYRAQARRAA